jgi:hypothetical protein
MLAAVVVRLVLSKLIDPVVTDPTCNSNVPLTGVMAVISRYWMPWYPVAGVTV